MQRPFPVVSFRYMSVTIRWGVAIPSPMKRNTYFAGFTSFSAALAQNEKSAAADVAAASKNVLKRLLELCFYIFSFLILVVMYIGFMNKHTVTESKSG